MPTTTLLAGPELHVDLDALGANARTFRQRSRGLVAVVKADAFGHGDVAQHLLAHGADWLGTTSLDEAVALWSRLLELYDATVASANAAYERIGQPGWIMCHLSHSYHSGACLYFTFAWVAGGDEITEYETVKSAIQQSFVDHGGAISHHHGVGFEHAPWLEQDISAEGVTVMRGLFAASDPQRILNPGAIVAD